MKKGCFSTKDSKVQFTFTVEERPSTQQFCLRLKMRDFACSGIFVTSNDEKDSYFLCDLLYSSGWSPFPLESIIIQYVSCDFPHILSVQFYPTFHWH